MDSHKSIQFASISMMILGIVLMATYLFSFLFSFLFLSQVLSDTPPDWIQLMNPYFLIFGILIVLVSLGLLWIKKWAFVLGVIVDIFILSILSWAFLNYLNTGLWYNSGALLLLMVIWGVLALISLSILILKRRVFFSFPASIISDPVNNDPVKPPQI